MPGVDPSTPLAPSGRAARGAVWPAGDLERRVCRALDLASAVVADFGDHGYADPVRPALGFGPEKVVAEAAMLAYAAHDASAAPAVRDRVDALAARIAPLVRSPRALAALALDPEQVFRRAVPHVLLTAMGHPDEDVDAFVHARCARVLAHALDQPPTVLAERRWIAGVWGRPLPEVPDAIAGTALQRPFDLLSGSREDPYGLTHALFYVTDFGRRTAVDVRRPVHALLADVEALVVRYLDHGDYDLVGELLMAWPQLHAAWSPSAAFAFRVLADVEDEVGLLPCGNLDPQRLASLSGAERTRYARAASYHTALVMGFLCAVALRGDAAPPQTVPGRQHPDDAWRAARAVLDDHPGDWRPVFDRRSDPEKRALVPLLTGLATAGALRRRDVPALRDAVELARASGLESHPLPAAAADLLRALGAASGLAAARERPVEPG